MVERLNLVGKKFGRLLVLKRSGSAPSGDIRWLCLCDCGVTKEINANSIRKGLTKSCGCYNKEQLSINKRTHGKTGTTEYRIWNGMIQRCYNTHENCYKRYGGKGITVCGKWLNSFEKFLEDMGERPSSKHSIDRYPNKIGNYEPSNCRWATYKEQNRNQVSNRWLEWEGVKMILADWAIKWNVTAGAIIGHFKRGKDFAAIFNHYELKSR